MGRDVLATSYMGIVVCIRPLLGDMEAAAAVVTDSSISCGHPHDIEYGHMVPVDVHVPARGAHTCREVHLGIDVPADDWVHDWAVGHSLACVKLLLVAEPPAWLSVP